MVLSQMRQVFSPRQVARAIGASESSVKRWCDRGVLPSIKTAGGHRRLPIAGILEFVRSENHQLANPEVLGLPPNLGLATDSLGKAELDFKEALVEGDFDSARRIVLDLFLAQESIAAIFDGVFTSALHDMGEDWCSGTMEVFQERRGCEIASRLMYELRSMVKLPTSDAPVAMGGSPESDPYTMPTRMVELVLVEAGWNAMSLGANIPMESMQRAIEMHRPRLFWLSVSRVDEESKFLESYSQLWKSCCSRTALVVGGRALTESLREKMEYTAHGENLQRLVSLANALHPQDTNGS